MSIRAIHLTPGTPRVDLSRRINFLDRCFERHPDFILRRIFHGVPKPVRKVRDPFLDHSKIPDKQIGKGHSEDPQKALRAIINADRSVQQNISAAPLAD